MRSTVRLFRSPGGHSELGRIPFLSVGGYALLQLVLKALSVFCFALLIFGIASFCRNALAVYGISTALVSVNFLLYEYPYLNSGNFFRICNLFSLSNSERLLVRYRCFSFFGHPFPVLAAALLFILPLSAVGVLLCHAFYHKSYAHAGKWSFKRLPAVVLPKKRQAHPPLLSVFGGNTP